MIDQHFKNYGFFEGEIPNDVKEMLLKEAETAEDKGRKMKSGLGHNDIPNHRWVIDSAQLLENYIMLLGSKYHDVYPDIVDVKMFTSSLPLVFNRPWFNFQRKGQYVPYHTHDGVYSFSLWLKIPSPCRFEFIYTNIIGEKKQYSRVLTSKDEGKIMFFPAKLPHIAYPFMDSDDVRISVSGNISFNTHGK
tara:strand:+ start:2373 stop:2945 length:573 start_codon:yes stop_codon:yes gene_type:complete